MINKKNSGTVSIYTVDSKTSSSLLEFRCPTIEKACKCRHITVHTVTLSSPSTIISCVEKVPQGETSSHITVADSEHGHSKLYDESMTSKILRDVHIPTRLMEDFLELSKDNTDKDLETCGILGASLEEGVFYATTLIIPKQESTSSSCQAINEEEVFAIQNEQSLFPVGWIHTHPSQTCFLSSVDVHTQYSYQIGLLGSCNLEIALLIDGVLQQGWWCGYIILCDEQVLRSKETTERFALVMVPEAFAIVMAPTDTSRSYGIFRLSDPGGLNVLKECQETGFHPHKELADGSSIYEDCSNVYKNSNLRPIGRDLNQRLRFCTKVLFMGPCLSSPFSN
ncbi:AMSH-like ubiquitin thioesterase 2 isoform X4 [Juglans microcarpa x Juglans regia]|uniref:AMSH-like ubiquitin thioesterase 2 isoform X4 n=1 Tax=Juglans microcarpa x Juglans regia TaxID=2249226 RepID=UPI001B7F4C02|nr:AMSH-like ubiquitin thioesterase 2 isoform X4 [Juglans microcarpa x Juglans regia]